MKRHTNRKHVINFLITVVLLVIPTIDNSTVIFQNAVYVISLAVGGLFIYYFNLELMRALERFINKHNDGKLSIPLFLVEYTVKVAYFVALFFGITVGAKKVFESREVYISDLKESCFEKKYVSSCKEAGQKLKEKKNFEESFTYYDKACAYLDMSACNKSAMLYVKNYLLLKKIEEQALGNIKLALKKSPEDPNYLDTYAAILSIQNEFEKAVEVQEKALFFVHELEVVASEEKREKLDKKIEMYELRKALYQGGKVVTAESYQ